MIEVGDVLHLPEDLGEIDAGLYAVAEVGWMITLSRLGENEDGDLCMTCRQFKVTYEEFEAFEPMGLRLDSLEEETHES